MCMKKTERSMHEAFILWCKQKPMISSSMWSFSKQKPPYMVMKRNVESEDVWNSKQLNRAPRNHPRSQVLKMETSSKLQNVVKRDKGKILYVFRERMWHLSKIEEKASTPSMVLTTGPHQEERGTSRFRLWKNLCALTGVVDWEADWELCTFHFLHSSLNNLLVFKIYMQRRKRYPFWNNRSIKPIFCNYINSFFKTQVWCIFTTWCWEDIYKY